MPWTCGRPLSRHQGEIHYGNGAVYAYGDIFRGKTCCRRSGLLGFYANRVYDLRLGANFACGADVNQIIGPEPFMHGRVFDVGNEATSDAVSSRDRSDAEAFCIPGRAALCAKPKEDMATTRRSTATSCEILCIISSAQIAAPATSAGAALQARPGGSSSCPGRCY
jgi:hypothetical protein